MSTKQQVTILDKVYIIGFSFKGIKLFEEMTGKAIQDIQGMWDNLLYAYCSLQALNKEFTLTIEEFVNILDEDPHLLAELYSAAQETETEEPKLVKTTETKLNKLGLFFGLWLQSILLLILLLLAPVLIPIILILILIIGTLKGFYRVIREGKGRHK